MIIRETNPGDLKLVKEMARLHLNTFPDYFLSMLGFPFMKAIYREYIERTTSFPCWGSLS